MFGWDPVQLAVAALAVGLVGLSKGGLGGAFGLMGVPLLSIYMPPLQAAALLLPFYLVMDAISLWSWWGKWDRAVLRAMLPAAIFGIAIGWLLAAQVSDQAVRLILGCLGLAFVADASFGGRIAALEARAILARISARIWGGAAGFTSFLAHAGGPPFQIHVLPKSLPPQVYTSTSVFFFAVVNAVKVLPYAALGSFDMRIVGGALVLLPVAAGATLLGAALVRRIPKREFYLLMYAMVVIVSLKLIYDGVFG